MVNYIHVYKNKDNKIGCICNLLINNVQINRFVAVLTILLWILCDCLIFWSCFSI